MLGGARACSEVSRCARSCVGVLGGARVCSEVHRRVWRFIIHYRIRPSSCEWVSLDYRGCLVMRRCTWVGAGVCGCA